MINLLLRITLMSQDASFDGEKQLHQPKFSTLALDPSQMAEKMEKKEETKKKQIGKKETTQVARTKSDLINYCH